MKRSTTLHNGQLQSEGKSAKDIQDDEYAQQDDVLMPDYIRKNEDEAVAWMGRKNSAYNEWKYSATSTNGTKPRFKQFFDEKERIFIKNRFGSSGGSRRRRRPSRKYKKSKRVFRKKSRYTRRR